MIVAICGASYGAVSSAAPADTGQAHSYSTARTGMQAITGGNSVNVRWNFNIDKSKITGYYVYRNGVKIGATRPGSTINFVDEQGTRYNDTAIKPNTRYTYQVRVVYKDGTTKKFSNKTTVTTPTRTTPIPTIVVNSGGAKDLDKWAKQVIVPELKTWYPKISDRIAYPAYTPPKKFTINFSSKLKPGVVASTSASKLTITLSTQHFRQPGALNDAGTVVHEMTHVIQNYGKNRDKTPQWIREGIADYGRNIIYADHPVTANSSKNYTAGYQTTAAFFDWIDRNYEKGYVRRLNVAAHSGKLSGSAAQFQNGKNLNDAWVEMLDLSTAE